MSLYDDDRYTWRETYFVLFDPRRRPGLAELRKELRPFRETLKITEAFGDVDGGFAKLIVASYEDHSALEIVFREGNDVVVETDALLKILEKDSTPKEKERIRAAKHCSAKFDVLHFEQTAGTAAFKVVKKPELKFPPPPHTDVVLRDSFSKKRPPDKLDAPTSKAPNPGPFARRPQFRFDPDSYENCLAGGVDDEYARKIDHLEAEAEAAEATERVDPNTLVLVLEILCRLTDGVAIDPASGTFF